MGRAFGAHWLANLAVLQAGEGQKLKETVKIAAAAVLAGVIQEASYCRFVPGDESCGDPLGVVNGGQLKKALKTFEADVEYVRALCQHGLVVKFITGPSCFVLAKEYPLLNGAARFDRMQCFVERQADLVKGLDITICLEYLRSSEDKAIGGYGQMQKLIDAVCREEIGYHADVFHALVTSMRTAQIDFLRVRIVSERNGQLMRQIGISSIAHSTRLATTDLLSQSHLEILFENLTRISAKGCLLHSEWPITMPVLMHISRIWA